MQPSVDAAKLTSLIADAKASGGSELANYQLFVERLCNAYGLKGPDMAREETALNDYVFERKVSFNLPDGTAAPGRIDCYKRGHFILEAKQSPKRKRQREEQEKATDKSQLGFFAGSAKVKGKPAKTGWDQIMLSARRQAEDYARALPVDHGYPPFLLIADVGHVIEVYADFSGQGKNYAHFPDRQSFRLSMDDLASDKVQQRLAAIWTDPFSLDPTRISAAVTKDVAERLAKIASVLEKKHDPKDVAEFLMRCLFTMFAEDAALIPKKSFETLLKQLKDTPKNFPVALESLWKVMNEGGYAPHINTTLKKFNGGLFKDCRALPLEADQIDELFKAAGKGWEDVEPAIFGTLLERALEPKERSKLGAHYTPRTYVERLVIPTIIEPLRADWQEVQNTAQLQLADGSSSKALQTVLKFHRKLCTTRVLDPACGTGNFLYVSFELMKLLEGEVLKAITDLGGQPDRYQDYPDEVLGVMKGQRLARNRGRFTVGPHQFYGLEINKRAVPIADLVLWIGYLKWQIRTSGLDSVTPPVLDNYNTIRQQDAILNYDRQDILRDDKGRPLSRWDGVTKKPHPITGEEIPDLDAQVPLYKYENPRPAPWPEAEFIVGNPPFIGNKRMRERLGIGYVDAMHKAYQSLGGSVDFVMYWWAKASGALTNGCRSFGFVTTNSIRQSSNRSVVRNALRDRRRIRFAIPDHPWVEDGAAVRVSMTAVDLSVAEGILRDVIKEVPEMILKERKGRIDERLAIGANFSEAVSLLGNDSLSFMGIIPVGLGFVVLPSELASLEIDPKLLPNVVKRYQNGKELAEGVQNRFIIDFHGLTDREASEQFPRLWQRILDRVKPVRDHVRRENHRRSYWIFGESRPAMRDALSALHRYIGTTETAKHRLFSFIPAAILPDQKIRVVASSAAELISVTSCRIHCLWSERNGGRQGVGNDLVYNNLACFDPFPFPDLSSNQALSDRLRELGERLDAFRKERLAAHDFLTMTGLYNALERYREVNAGIGEPLSAAERDVHEAGLISVLAEIHDDIDRATLAAYGWGDLIPALVGKVGGTVPSDHKSEAQLEAEETLLTRLVALNHERAAEEKRGVIRWLRPDYQIPKLGAKAAKVKAEELDLEIVEEAIKKPKWPTDDQMQMRAIFEALRKSEGLASAAAIAASFDGRNTAARKARVAKVLETLVITGAARLSADHDKYFVPR